MAAHDRAGRELEDVGCPLQDFPQQLEGNFLPRPADQAEREQGTAAHRVDIAHRVRGGDGSPIARVVHDGREEVGGGDERAVGGDAHDCGVITRRGVDQDVGPRVPRQALEHLAQVDTAELAGAARAVRKRRETNWCCCRHITCLAMSDITTLATALVLGFLHALEIDHMLAVTTFVSRRPALATAAGFGLRWGLGHSLAVLALGGILLATGIQWPDRWTSYGEAAVGILLVGLGLWSLRASRNLHLH